MTMELFSRNYKSKNAITISINLKKNVAIIRKTY